jgi:DNA-binding transcriptional ArsR family regulator
MPGSPLAVVAGARQARLLLDPLRRRILAAAREPASAAALAAALGLPRQRVNYHVRLLARAGFLTRAGRRRRRGLVEQRYVVSAEAFLLAPEVLGGLEPGPPVTPDQASAAFLIALAARMQSEAGRAWRDAGAQRKRLPVLALDTTIAFTTADQRARFAAALTESVTRLVAEHTSAPTSGAKARRYRLALGCYPIPGEAKPQTRKHVGHVASPGAITPARPPAGRAP